MNDSTIESVESFRARAREWLAATMPRREGGAPGAAGVPEDDTAEWERNRELQKKLYAGGFAGICFPKEYGGLGLTPEHQQAFTEESDDYEMPLMLNMPTFGICAATLSSTATWATTSRSGSRGRAPPPGRAPCRASPAGRPSAS